MKRNISLLKLHKFFFFIIILCYIYIFKRRPSSFSSYLLLYYKANGTSEKQGAQNKKNERTILNTEHNEIKILMEDEGAKYENNFQCCFLNNKTFVLYRTLHK